MKLRRYVSFAILLWCTACVTHTAPTPAPFSQQQTDFTDLPGWKQENHAEALDVFLASCPALIRHPQEKTQISRLQIATDVWSPICVEGNRARGNEEQARLFFEKRFAPYRVMNGKESEGLFTGYYEPLLHGSRVKAGKFIYPLYLPPPELKTHKPYFTRAEIDHGALANRHLEFLWVDDPVMLFFLHVQGSGQVVLPDGEAIRVGFADKNGQPYVGLGKVAGDEGLIPKNKIDFFTLREWLYAHPDRAQAIMENNTSYIFFKEINGSGPTGTLNVVLTPGRSMAVDTRYIPLGVPLFLSTQLPTAPDSPNVTIHRLMIAQDSGTAIQGPIRGDIFFGAGKDAEYRAGMMKSPGSYMMLVPREIFYQLR